MIENLNELFVATYFHNKHYFGIQSLAVMSLLGIGLGLVSQLFLKRRKETGNSYRFNKS